MTVKDLIKKLEEVPQDAEVFIYNAGDDERQQPEEIEIGICTQGLPAFLEGKRWDYNGWGDFRSSGFTKQKIAVCLK